MNSKIDFLKTEKNEFLSTTPTIVARIRKYLLVICHLRNLTLNQLIVLDILLAKLDGVFKMLVSTKQHFRVVEEKS